MLREILIKTKRSNGSGFALPTVMIVAVVMMIILVTAVQASASVRTALSNQYYNNLASEAAEAGAMFANACIQKGNGYASWGQLQPNTDCKGNGINGVISRYLVEQSDMRSTFTVSYNSDANADQYNLTVNGSLQLLRKSAPDTPWKTINVKRKLQVQPCTKTVTNLIPNPSFEVDTSGWSAGGANIARTTYAGGTSNTDGSYTLQVQSTGTNESVAATTTPLVPGKTYTVSGIVHIPDTGFNTSGAHARSVSIAIFYVTSTGAYNNNVLAKAPTTNPGYQRVSTSFTVPSDVSDANAQAAFLRLYNGAVSGSVYWDNIMLIEGDNKDASFKDGDYPGWTWNGTYNNATSTGPVKTACTSTSPCTLTNLITNPNLESGTPTNWVGSSATALPDATTWRAGGSRSLSITPTTTNGDSFASIGGDDGGLRLGMQPGKTYTVSATMRIDNETGLTGVNAWPWRRAGIVVHTWNPVAGFNVYTVNPSGVHQYNGGEPTNQSSVIAKGTYKLKTTFTVPINAPTAFIRLYNGGTNGQPPVFWDNIALYEGTRAPYYDGDSPGWSWSGTQHLSTSSGPIVPCNAPITY
jgi:Tfp pilus assembly major pilin PilA